MNKYILIGFVIVLSFVVLPVSANNIAEGEAYFQKSEMCNVGYNIVESGDDTIWTIWNSKNFCKILYEDEINRDELRDFKEAVDKCFIREDEYNVESQKTNSWWNLRISLSGLIGQKYKGENLERAMSDADFHFESLY